MTKPKKDYAPLVLTANEAAAEVARFEANPLAALGQGDEAVTAVEVPVPQHETKAHEEAVLRGHRHDLVEPWRGTGRTTAMLAKAWERADKGDAVVVLVPDARVAEDFKRVMPASERVFVVTPSMAYTLHGRGFDHVFIDHSAWETLPFETAEFLVAIRPRVRRG